MSGVVSEEMAKGVTNMFLSDYAIGLTGYASPVTEIQENNLFAYFSITKNLTPLLKGKILYKSKEYGFTAQVFYTNEGLKKFASVLK